jgi:Mn2+/Fe2+ NRAMP family transporter
MIAVQNTAAKLALTTGKSFPEILSIFYSNIIAYAIIVSSAVTLIGHERIQSMSDAALALKPVAGEHAFVIFSISVITWGIFSYFCSCWFYRIRRC